MKWSDNFRGGEREKETASLARNRTMWLAKPSSTGAMMELARLFSSSQPLWPRNRGFGRPSCCRRPISGYKSDAIDRQDVRGDFFVCCSSFIEVCALRGFSGTIALLEIRATFRIY